jgi:hypothetical protein
LSWGDTLVIALGGNNRQLNNPVPFLVLSALVSFGVLCYSKRGELAILTSCLGGAYVKASVEFKGRVGERGRVGVFGQPSLLSSAFSSLGKRLVVSNHLLFTPWTEGKSGKKKNLIPTRQ